MSRNSASFCQQGVDWHVLCLAAGELCSFQFTAFYSSQSLCLQCEMVACWVPNKTPWWVCPGRCCLQLITYKSLLASSLSLKVCSSACSCPFALCREWFRPRAQSASWLDRKPVALQCLRLEFKLLWHRTCSAANIRCIVLMTVFQQTNTEQTQVYTVVMELHQ